MCGAAEAEAEAEGRASFPNADMRRGVPHPNLSAVAAAVVVSRCVARIRVCMHRSSRFAFETRVFALALAFPVLSPRLRLRLAFAFAGT